MMTERTHVLLLRTPEGVAFTFRIASPVLRAGAAVVDWAVVAAAWSVIAIPVALLGIVSADIAGLVQAVLFFLLSQGYRIAAEWRWRGQSVGKRMLRLRVVDAHGLQLTFSQIVLRNLLRFVDALPSLYLVGGVVALLNARGQRLGDLAAGTLVVWEPYEPAPDFAALRSDKYNSLRAHTAVVARLRQAVSVGEARAAWAAIARRDEFEPGARVQLFGDLARHFARVGAVPAEVVDQVSDEQFVRNVVDVLYLSRSANSN
jgi:uncharacterized RDD family membrane protein YckC